MSCKDYDGYLMRRVSFAMGSWVNMGGIHIRRMSVGRPNRLGRIASNFVTPKSKEETSPLQIVTVIAKETQNQPEAEHRVCRNSKSPKSFGDYKDEMDKRLSLLLEQQISSILRRFFRNEPLYSFKGLELWKKNMAKTAGRFVSHQKQSSQDLPKGACSLRLICKDTSNPKKLILKFEIIGTDEFRSEEERAKTEFSLENLKIWID